MNHELNPAQEEALDLARHVNLTAVAGSGKTTVLVERFVRILARNGFRPEQIVAITFTEEAASEMKKRIRESISNHAGTNPGPSGAPWNQALARLSLARITTIHGFCMSLLREYPLHLDLNPDFRVLPASGQESMLWSSVQDVLRFLASPSSPTLQQALQYMPASRIREILLAMLRKRELFRDAQPRVDRFDSIAGIYRMETAAFLWNRREFENLRQILSRLPPGLVLGQDSCSRRCRSQLDLFRKRETLSREQFLGEFANTMEGRISPSRLWKNRTEYQELKELWSEIRGLLRNYPLSPPEATPTEDHHFKCAMESLLGVYEFTREFYQERKRKNDALDFDDLLEKARELVVLPEVSREIQERYPYFLVDEFQDTNPIQWEILEPLIGRRSNLFVVGDAKQSIYRFRNADVSLFGRVREWIKTRGKCVNMPQNYRSLPGLIDFHNHLFRDLFRGDLPYEAHSQAMEACRSSTAGERGTVEVLVHPEDAGRSDAELTAGRIRELIEYDGCSPREIVVLLRTRTHLKEYEEEFGRLGIPFETMGGMGFFDRQEVLDLINFYRLLLNPEDSAALVGLLRSPFFSFSDDDIFEISRFEGAGYRSKLHRAVTEKGRASPEHWRFADSTLRDWLQMDPGYSLSERLARAIYDTGYQSILECSGRKLQLRANTEKLQEIVRNFETGGRRTIREFVRFIDTLIQSRATEAESVHSDIQGDAVRIYTVHGAKGLQFPTVVVPEMGAPFSATPTSRFHCERLSDCSTYFAARIWNPDEGYSNLAHPAYEMLRRLDHYRQIAEEKRLLYVAATRACDRLVLVGRNTEAPSWLGWLRESNVPFNLESWKEFGAEDTPARWSTLQGRLREDPTISLPCISKPESVKKHWTPTEISLFRTCPRKYQLTQLGRRVMTGERPGDRSATIGSAVHEILQRIQNNPGTSVDSELRLWERRLEPFHSTETTPIIDEIRANIERVRSSTFFERILHSRKRFTESQFTATSGELRLTGKIDCLFEELDGRWTVVDFKTSRVRTEEAAEVARAEGYDLQLELYLWATARILGVSSVEGFLLFTTTGDLLRIDYGPAVEKKCRDVLSHLPGSLDPAAFPRTENLQACSRCIFLELGACSGGGPRQPSLFA